MKLHLLNYLLYALAALFIAAGLRALWLVAQTPTPDRAPDDSPFHFQLGETTPRADRLRLMSIALLGVGVVLAVITRKIS